MEAEVSHRLKGKDVTESEAYNNQVTASAMMIENLREDISRLTSENKRLLGWFNDQLQSFVVVSS